MTNFQEFCSSTQENALALVDGVDALTSSDVASRNLKLGLITKCGVLAIAFASSSVSAQNSKISAPIAAPIVNEQVRTSITTVTEQSKSLSSGLELAIKHAKKALPEHSEYVDDHGNFDIRQAAKDIFETGGYSAPDAVQKAQEMAIEWDRMVLEKSSEIV